MRIFPHLHTLMRGAARDLPNILLYWNLFNYTTCKVTHMQIHRKPPAWKTELLMVHPSRITERCIWNIKPTQLNTHKKVIQYVRWLCTQVFCGPASFSTWSFPHRPPLLVMSGIGQPSGVRALGIVLTTLCSGNMLRPGLSSSGPHMDYIELNYSISAYSWCLVETSFLPEKSWKT